MGLGCVSATATAPPLASCDDDAFSCSAGDYCLGAFGSRNPFDYCARPCARDADCGDASLWCMVYPGGDGVCLRKGDIAEGESCTEGSVWVCGGDVLLFERKLPPSRVQQNL